MSQQVDPIDLYIQQLMAQAIPEWSVSKGEQPVDIGTLSQNMNYRQDVRSDVFNPESALLSGNVNPALFDPVVVEQPDPPETPRLSTWAKSPNEIQQLILQGVSEGLDPRMVVKRLTDPGPNGEAPVLELPVDDNGKVDTSEFDYYVAEASALRDEVYAATQYQMQLANPKTAPSPATVILQGAGFSSTPADRFAPEDFVPEVASLQSNAQGMRDDWARGRKQIIADDIGARAALLKHAGLPMQGTSQSREGWTDIRQDGSRVEKLGLAIRDSMQEIGDIGGGVPSNLTASGLASSALGGAARLGVGAMDWAFGRPSPGDEEKPDRNAAVLAELKRRVEEDGGPGVGQKMRTGIANFIQNNTTERSTADQRRLRTATRQQGRRAFEEQTRANYAKREAERSARIAAQRGFTPFALELMGRTGL
jgi:hypothetical protein